MPEKHLHVVAPGRLSQLAPGGQLPPQAPEESLPHGRTQRAPGAGQHVSAPSGLTQMQTWTDALAAPGDFSSSTLTVTGSYVLHSPAGARLLLGAGRTSFAPDGTTVFQSGPSGFFDLVSGDSAAIAAVCDALQ